MPSACSPSLIALPVALRLLPQLAALPVVLHPLPQLIASPVVLQQFRQMGKGASNYGPVLWFFRAVQPKKSLEKCRFLSALHSFKGQNRFT